MDDIQAFAAASTTHDTSASAFHIPDLNSLLSHLTDAVSAAWPDRQNLRSYKKVKVILMSWENDDLNVDAEISPLLSVFRGLYHYDAESWKIPSRRPAVELSRKVADVVDTYGREGNLLIFYYAGHARPNDQPGGSPVWVANRSRNSATVHSSVMHSLLSELDCDVLLLHDCPHATQEGDTFSSGNGVLETLAACGFEPTTADLPGRHAFTSSLVQELAHAAHTRQWLSTVELHRRMINRLQAFLPSVHFVDDTYSVVQVNRETGMPMFEMPRRRTPIYSFASQTPRTIVLTPLSHTSSQAHQDDTRVILNAPTTNIHGSNGPDVLVAVRLKGQNFDVERWKSWLGTLSAEVRGRIKVAGIYPSFSLLLILRMSLLIWDMLPASPAISFIGFTSGRDHIKDFLKLSDPFAADEEESEAETGQGPKREKSLKHSTSRKGRRKSGSAPGENGEEDEDSDTEIEEEIQQAKTKSTKLGKGGRRKHAAQSAWPKVFQQPRAQIYWTEDEPYCLSQSEISLQHGSTTDTKTERIIEAFLGDVNEPSKLYMHDEIREFLMPADFEALQSGQEPMPLDPVAVLDERFPDTDSGGYTGGVSVLNPRELFEALLPKPPPTLIETGSGEGHPAIRRRVIHIPNPNAWSTMAMAAAASRSQAVVLSNFVYRHLAFHPAVGVNILSSGQQTFELSFNLPYLAWRKDGAKTAHQSATGRQKTELTSPIKTATSPTVYEAQMSVMITGIDDHFWTAYGFFDTSHDGTESKRDIHLYDASKSTIRKDPLTGGRYASDPPVWTAREYFLRVLETCVGEAKDELCNTGVNLMKMARGLTRNNGKHSIDGRKAQKTSHDILHLLEQLQQVLEATVASWDRFQETSLSYFDLGGDSRPVLGHSHASQTSQLLKSIEADVHQLRVLCDSLNREKEALRSLGSTILTSQIQTSLSRTNALATTILAFLPFTFVAVLANATPDDLFMIQVTPTRYVLTSAGVACLAAGLYLALTLSSSPSDQPSTDRIREIVTQLREIITKKIKNSTTKKDGRGRSGSVKITKGEDGDWTVGEVEHIEDIEDAETKSGGWQKQKLWWPSTNGLKGKTRYRDVPERDGAASPLPF